MTPVPQPLWSVQSEDIVAVVVEDFGSGEILEVHREVDELWGVVSPNAGPADADRVERAVSWLASPSPRAEVLDVIDLSAFQLDRPRYRVEIVLRDGSRNTFQVGRQSPTGGSSYVLVPGRVGVAVVSDLGLEEVLTLRDDLLVTPSPEGDATEQSMPGSPTAAPTNEEDS